jgi:hypothetical protein
LPSQPRRIIEERLRAEVGAIPKQAPLRIALAYPSPHRGSRSDFQRIYCAIQDGRHDVRARVSPDGAVSGEKGEMPVTYESRTPPPNVGPYAYELEIAE